MTGEHPLYTVVKTREDLKRWAVYAESRGLAELGGFLREAARRLSESERILATKAQIERVDEPGKWALRLHFYAGATFDDVRGMLEMVASWDDEALGRLLGTPGESYVVAFDPVDRPT